MSVFEQIQKKIPGYSFNDWQIYVHWAKNLPILELMLDSVVLASTVSESEADALRRLGKIEFLLRLKQSVKVTNDIVRQLNLNLEGEI
jgi:hypothetical protein